MSRPLVFLSGWRLGRGAWQPTADALGGEILDLPGYGAMPPCSTFDAAADALAARIAPGSLLCGWSLGAMLAVAIAARAPERIAGLALVAGTASFVQRADWPHAMPTATLAEFRAAILADAAAVLPRFVGNFNRGDRNARAVTRELLDRADPSPSLETLTTGLDWLRDTDLRAIAPTVTAPTLLLHGAVDPLMPLAAAESLAALLPNARLTALADCAHAPFISAPEAFRTALAAFADDPST